MSLRIERRTRDAVEALIDGSAAAAALIARIARGTA
jgi:hypothetical protein